MTRVSSAATAVRARRSVSSAIAKRNTDKKQYKVEYKLVTAQKKQLKISNNPPPPTYAFVAAGSEAFTNYCKDICRKTGRTVHASQSRTDPERRARVVNDPNRVGYYIGRDGFFFPKDVIQKACNWFGVRIDRAGKTTEPNDYLSTRVRDALGRHGQHDERQQIEAAVREMFPKIPQQAAGEIIKHAFESAPKPGQKQRVGNARDLDLAGRVQLAVNAHIRHMYTNYDQLLKNGMSWPEARATIGPTCVAILRNWMGEDNQPELEETFQEWIDLCDDDEDDEDTSSMEGISDSESGRRTSLNGIHTVHEASNGMASSSHNRVPVHDFRDDTRMVRYRPELEHILPSIESPPRHEQGPQRPSSYHGPQYPPQPILHAAPPPPAPSPPKYRAPPGAFYERHLPQTSMPSLRRVDSDRVVYHPDPARTAPRDYRADVIDLTSSPTFPRTLREADYAPRHLGAPDLPVYATPQQGFLPRAIDMGPLRGGEGNPRDDHRRYEMQEPDNTVHLSNARQVSRVDNGVQPARSAVDGTRPPVYEPFQALQSHSHPLIARNNRNNEMVQQLGNSRLPPPPNMTLDRPHPNVPRTGWVTYTAMTRQGEAVRLWHLLGTAHRHEGFCQKCEALVLQDVTKRSSPVPVPSSPGIPSSVMFIASNEL